MTGHSLRRLADAPHRLFFFLGTINLVAASAWWLAAMLSRQFQPALLAAQNGLSAYLHPLIMVFGFFPFFILGFAFTAGPRWLQVEAPGPKKYLLPGIGMGLAFLSTFPAMFAGDGALLIALVTLAGCWCILWLHFCVLVAHSKAPDKVHARLVQLCLAVGIATLWAAIAGISAGHEWRALVRSAGVWGFLVPLFCTVCHRMLPFFTASAIDSQWNWRPWWVLGAMVIGAWFHGLLDYHGAVRWLWLVDGPMAFIGFHIVVRWGLIQSLSNRLLAMLHLGFIWLAIGYALSFVQSLCAHAGVAVLGLGPLHAVLIGFLGSLAIAMVTRVTCGHSGRTLAADKVTWMLFLVFQLAAVSRIAAEAFPAHYADLVTLASAVWFSCFGLWAWRNAPVYLSPRQDGMPG
jgi:uncharacterized protein involved in response to NO